MTGHPATASRDAQHFDDLYAASDDPWNFRGSSYERRKYAATIAALPPRHFAAALEIGCSIGELTRLLAPACGSLLALDIAQAPLRTAGSRNADLKHVEFHQLAVPRQWPAGGFDLIVLSELLYFLSAEDVRAVASRVDTSLRRGGVVLLVNFLGITDDPLSGDTAAETFLSSAGPPLIADFQHRDDNFRIDRLIHR